MRDAFFRRGYLIFYVILGVGKWRNVRFIDILVDFTDKIKFSLINFSFR